VLGIGVCVADCSIASCSVNECMGLSSNAGLLLLAFMKGYCVCCNDMWVSSLSSTHVSCRDSCGRLLRAPGVQQSQWCLTAVIELVLRPELAEPSVSCSVQRGFVIVQRSRLLYTCACWGLAGFRKYRFWLILNRDQLSAPFCAAMAPRLL
jgi:hypothetical protein